MEKKKAVTEALTPQEAEKCRKIIKKRRQTPSVIGTIFLQRKPLHPGLLLWLLVDEGFADDDIILVFLGGMTEESIRSFLKQKARWEESRIDQAFAKA